MTREEKRRFGVEKPLTNAPPVSQARESDKTLFIRNTEGTMTSLEIKFLVYQKWQSITAAARELRCSRSQLSYCIARRRISPQIREKLASGLGIPVEEMFGKSSPEARDRRRRKKELPVLDSCVNKR